MSQPTACVKCGSSELLAGRMMDRIHNVLQERDVQLRVDGDPQALLLTETERRPVHAVVCGNCGFVELWAADPAGLLAAWRHSQQRTD
ncbi:MAG: hypothetical protein ABI759_02940 [Candidatus Solibacter sp.]